MVAGRLLLTVQSARDLQPQETPDVLTASDAGPAKLVCKCRVGHETQWTHSKLAEPCDEEDTEESLDACWNCLVPLNIDNNAQAVHLGVYAVQSRELHEGMSRSSSLLSSVGRKFSSNSKKAHGPGLLQRLASRSSRRNSMQVEERDISLRELMLETAPEMGTPFTQRREQHTDGMHNVQAAAYFGQPESSKDSCSSSLSSRGPSSNQENEYEPSHGKIKVGKVKKEQVMDLIGGVRIPIGELLESPNDQLSFPLYDKAKQQAGTVQVTSRFTALVREGWLQYRAEGSSTKLLGKAWKVGWFELLADGRLTWFPSPDKRCNENRGQIIMSSVQAMGLSVAFKSATNARSYMEVLHRTPFSTRVQVLSLKANHPDDARLWLRDMQNLAAS